MPTVDGAFLPADPLTAIAAGRFHRVPVVLGSVANETAGWIPKVANYSSVVDLLLQLEWSDLRAEVKRTYSPQFAHDPWGLLNAALTDYLFNCYARQLALAMVANGHADVRCAH